MSRIWQVMTSDRENLLATFEVRIGDLIAFCERLKGENARLQETLGRKEAEIDELRQTIEDLHARYEHLLTAKIASVREGDVRSARQRLSNLVREVDRCIALLNE